MSACIPSEPTATLARIAKYADHLELQGEDATAVRGLHLALSAEHEAASKPGEHQEWRLLTSIDTVEKGDEGLNDDCTTWHPVTWLFWRHRYNPALFVPMRRRVARGQ